MMPSVPSLPAQQPDQVVPGVVLGRRGEPAQDPPVGQDRLEPDDLGPHAPVADDPDPAGVGRDEPADAGLGAGRQVDPDVESGRLGVFLHALQPGAGADRHLAGDRVDRIHCGQSGQAQQDLAAARHAAADQPGVPALGGDGDPGRGAVAHHGGDLFGVGRADHGPGHAVEAPGPVHFVRCPQVVLDQHVRGADHRAQLILERHHAPRETQDTRLMR